MADIAVNPVAELRRRVADELGAYLHRCSQEGRRQPDELDQRQMARAIIRRELDEMAKDSLHRGGRPLSEPEEQEITAAVLAAAFSVSPALERLLERADVTDVHANGYDDVRLVLVDGTVEPAGPLGTSDADLLVMIQALARRGGHMEREFTPAHPHLDLQLPDGSRLAAAAWVTSRPYLTIRRHLLVDADQVELVRRGMYGSGVASLRWCAPAGIC